MDFLDLVKLRHSVRSYDERPIESSKLNYIMECVRLAPSAVNYQPWLFTVVSDKEKLSTLKGAYQRSWITNVPCIVVACADHTKSWHRPSDNKDHADIDAAIAIEHLCLAAAEQGLGSCWICNFDTEYCKKAMALPNHVEPIALITLGYANETNIPEKKRKPLSEILF